MKAKIANPYGDFQTDTNLETSGVWINYETFRVRLARMGGSNTAYSRALDKHARALRRTGMPTVAKQKRMQTELLLETSILEWQVRNEKGIYVPGVHDPETFEVVEPTKANIDRVLTAQPNLAEALISEASSQDLYLTEELEEEAGN